MHRRTIEQWQTLFKQHDESGVTASQFCREQGLCPRYFSKRKRDLGWRNTRSTGPKLVKLTKPEPTPFTPSVRLQFGQVSVRCHRSG
ncbi:IS66 family insertion sequence element accessory protein TnpA [Alteromonas oceanisediminis]|uniref:IS66 family insertion sequence element accessory protein TnpA n=1 Tax=Alteromonas oceanisediminis TaxID=2836180 RepID=UPI001BDACD48|nr:hypothetical protein [Alteromonas oceanisediminis]MBT0587982.1 hypothetical protein [Alteromonas oceanisediminis]